MDGMPIRRAGLSGVVDGSRRARHYRLEHAASWRFASIGSISHTALIMSDIAGAFQCRRGAMDTRNSFAEIWKEAHRERSEYVWSLICRMLASPRTQARALLLAEEDQRSATVDALPVKHEKQA
jgi:hypothetical protein